jgi:hypothetical protein
MEEPEDVKGKGREKAVVEDVRKKPTFVRGLFSPDGRRIYLGTKGGELLVLDGKTRGVGSPPPSFFNNHKNLVNRCILQVVDRVKISNSAVRTMEFDRAGRSVHFSLISEIS